MKLQQKLSLSRAEEWIEEGNFFEGPATLRSKSFPTGPILVGDNGPYTDGDPVTLSDTEGLLSVKLKSSKYRPVFEGGRREVTIIAKFTSADGVRMCEDSIAVVWKR